MGSYTTIVAALDKSDGGALKRAASLQVDAELSLAREPNNPFDPNAVIVKHGNDKLGYLPRSIAEWVSERIELDRYTKVFVHEVDVQKRFFSAKITRLLVTLATSPYDAPPASPDFRDAYDDRLRQIENQITHLAIDRHTDEIYSAIAVLKWLANEDGKISDREEALIDDFVLEFLVVMSIHAGPEFVGPARSSSRHLKGSKKKALDGVATIVKNEALVRLVGKYLGLIARSDNQVSEQELSIVSQFAAEVHRLKAH